MYFLREIGIVWQGKFFKWYGTDIWEQDHFHVFCYKKNWTYSTRFQVERFSVKSQNNSPPHVDFLFRAQLYESRSLVFHKEKAQPWVLASKIERAESIYIDSLCAGFRFPTLPKHYALIWSGFRAIEDLSFFFDQGATS